VPCGEPLFTHGASAGARYAAGATESRARESDSIASPWQRWLPFTTMLRPSTHGACARSYGGQCNKAAWHARNISTIPRLSLGINDAGSVPVRAVIALYLNEMAICTGLLWTAIGRRRGHTTISVRESAAALARPRRIDKFYSGSMATGAAGIDTAVHGPREADPRGSHSQAQPVESHSKQRRRRRHPSGTQPRVTARCRPVARCRIWPQLPSTRRHRSRADRRLEHPARNIPACQ
jgi:hypothetical protein